MVCIRRERVQVPCAELARRIERTDSLGDRLTGAPGFEPATSRFVVAERARTPTAMEHDSSYFQPETLGAELAASVTRTYRLSQGVGTELGT